jgi:hypothetical protein
VCFHAKVTIFSPALIMQRNNVLILIFFLNKCINAATKKARVFATINHFQHSAKFLAAEARAFAIEGSKGMLLTLLKSCRLSMILLRREKRASLFCRNSNDDKRSFVRKNDKS